jgi:hypothetical protein
LSSKNKGTYYDATVVDTCLSVFLEKGFQFEGTLFQTVSTPSDTAFRLKPCIFIEGNILLLSGSSESPLSPENPPPQNCNFQPVIVKNSKRAHRFIITG